MAPDQSKMQKLDLQRCSYVLKKYSRGPPTRIKLEKMACSVHNRGGMGVNGKHAHDIWRKDVVPEGLVQWRYNHGYALAPNPKNPFENADHTNAYVAKQRDLLAPVTREHHPGSLAKTHLWHACLTAKQGNFSYYSDKTPMVVNKDDDEMNETMENGLFYVILEYQAFIDEPDAVLNLVKAENRDAANSLKNTEVALMREYLDKSKKITVMNNQTLWSVLQEKVNAESYSPDFCQAACSLALKLQDQQMLFLCDVYQYYVNPKSRSIGCQQMMAVSKMPAKYPWCKICILVCNLVCLSSAKDKSSSSEVGVGSAVPPGAIASMDKLKVFGVEVWEFIEKTVNSIVTKKYLEKNLIGCDAFTLLSRVLA